jgi:hypothetical protein
MPKAQQIGSNPDKCSTNIHRAYTALRHEVVDAFPGGT